MTARDPDPHHCAVRLHTATTRLGRQLRALAAPAEVTAAGLSVLGLLTRHGPLAPTEIAAHEGVRLQTLTRLLAELETAGLVRRQADPADARRTLLSLTRAGAHRLGAQVRQREAVLQRAIAALPARERSRLLAACDLLDEIASALAGSEVSPA
jgi:DNA-binding MarR family transcriptional regulator